MAANDEQNAISSINNLPNITSINDTDYLYVAQKLNSTDTTYDSRKAQVDVLYNYIKDKVIMNSGGYPFIYFDKIQPCGDGSKYNISADSMLIFKNLYNSAYNYVNFTYIDAQGQTHTKNVEYLNKLAVAANKNSMMGMKLFLRKSLSASVQYGVGTASTSIYIMPLMNSSGLFIDYVHAIRVQCRDIFARSESEYYDSPGPKYEPKYYDGKIICESNTVISVPLYEGKVFFRNIEYNRQNVLAFDNNPPISWENFVLTYGIPACSDNRYMLLFKAGTIVHLNPNLLSDQHYLCIAHLM